MRKNLHIIGYLLLSAAIVVGLWASRENRIHLQNHLNSHIERDQSEFQTLELEVCRRLNIVQRRLRLKLTNCHRKEAP